VQVYGSDPDVMGEMRAGLSGEGCPHRHELRLPGAEDHAPRWRQRIPLKHG